MFHELQKIHISENFSNLVEYDVWFLVHFWAFRQFPTFNLGLAHYGSRPFMSLLCCGTPHTETSFKDSVKGTEQLEGPIF